MQLHVWCTSWYPMLFHYLFFPNENYFIYKLPPNPHLSPPPKKKNSKRTPNVFAFTARQRLFWRYVKWMLWRYVFWIPIQILLIFSLTLKWHVLALSCKPSKRSALNYIHLLCLHFIMQIVSSSIFGMCFNFYLVTRLWEVLQTC